MGILLDFSSTSGVGHSLWRSANAGRLTPRHWSLPPPSWVEIAAYAAMALLSAAELGFAAGGSVGGRGQRSGSGSVSDLESYELLGLPVSGSADGLRLAPWPSLEVVSAGSSRCGIMQR